MDMKIVSKVNKGKVTAYITLPSRNPAKNVVLRLRHPEGKRMIKVTINGKDWKEFSASNETIILPVNAKRVEVVAEF
jgi:hypothetical protein